VVARLKAKVAELEGRACRRAAALGWSPGGLRARAHRPYGRHPGPTGRRTGKSPHASRSGAAVCPGSHRPDMERDDLAPADTLAAHDRMTRHVMVGCSDLVFGPLRGRRGGATARHASLDRTGLAFPGLLAYRAAQRQRKSASSEIDDHRGPYGLGGRACTALCFEAGSEQLGRRGSSWAWENDRG